MSVFLKLLYSVCVAAMFVTVPLFLKYGWPEKCKKSLLFKMISSTLFVLSGVLAILISNNRSSFAILMLIGLILGWFGDLFLHLLTDKMLPFVIGVVAFLAGHVFYIIAFCKAIKKTYPKAHVFEWYEILGVLLFVAAIVVYAVLTKIKLNPKIMGAGLIAYALTIGMMFAKALHLCFGELVYGTFPHMIALFVFVALGALLFVLSDSSLGLILFGGQGKNRPLKIFNIITYYVGQVLLAASIFIVTSPTALA